jgi:hypothetical protein
MVRALLDAEPPVVQKTGRTRATAINGGDREAVEIELLVDEDDLSRCCYYCGALETTSDVRDGRMERLSGEGYESTYCCSQVCGMQSLRISC